MYMPGRLRTASRPSSTWIADASYSTPLGGSGTGADAGDSTLASGRDCSGVTSLTRTSSSGPRPLEGSARGRIWHGSGRVPTARGLDLHDTGSGAAFHAAVPRTGTSVDEIRPQAARKPVTERRSGGRTGPHTSAKPPD